MAVVYLFVLHRLAKKCTIYKTRTTIAPLINRLLFDVFSAAVVFIRSLLLWSVKSHVVDVSVFLSVMISFASSLEVFEKFQANKNAA